MQTYDAIIIGSGQGGGPLAHKLADLGQRVALIEREHLGGSCINYGCTPTKTMIASARIAHYARRAAEFGVRTGDVSIDFPKVVERKNGVVLAWREGQEKLAEQRPTLDLHRGHARFTAAHEVEVNGETLTDANDGKLTEGAIGFQGGGPTGSGVVKFRNIKIRPLKK